MTVIRVENLSKSYRLGEISTGTFFRDFERWFARVRGKPDPYARIDVQAPADLWPPAHRSYFVWRYGKVPEVVIEIVSNRKGKEDSDKLRDYAGIGILFSVIFDPAQHLSDRVCRVDALHAGAYEEHPTGRLSKAQIGVRVWAGGYEGVAATWLRWCYEDGTLNPTGAEQAAQERERAEQERERAARLAARLRELGIDPDALAR